VVKNEVCWLNVKEHRHVEIKQDVVSIFISTITICLLLTCISSCKARILPCC